LQEGEYTGKINIGMQVSFGAEYAWTKNIHIFAELTTVNTKYTFKKRVITRYEIDGVDAIAESESTTTDDWHAKISYDHIGLNIGLRYILK
jgi:hypothetical protein